MWCSSLLTRPRRCSSAWIRWLISAAGTVVGRNHQRVLRRFSILARDGGDALVVALNFMDSALPVKVLDCLAHFATRKLLDDLFQFRVFLAHDLFELHRPHAGVLKLREGPSGLDRLMLPPVADQQHAVIRMEPVHKLMQLPGRCQRGFVEHIEPLLASIGLLATCQMLLERRCLHACLGELLRRAGRWRETFDLVSLGLRAFADHGQRCCLARACNAVQSRQSSRAKEGSHLPPDVVKHSVPGAGLPSRCAPAAKPASDRRSRADCLPASGQ